MARFERYAIRVISALVVMMTLWTAYRLESTVRGHSTSSILCACAPVPCPVLSRRTSIVTAVGTASPLPSTTSAPPTKPTRTPETSKTMMTSTTATTATIAAPTTAVAQSRSTSTQTLETKVRPVLLASNAMDAPQKNVEKVFLKQNVTAEPVSAEPTPTTPPPTEIQNLDAPFTVRQAMDPDAARNTVRNDVGFSFSDRRREDMRRQQMRDFESEQHRVLRGRRRFGQHVTEPPKDAGDKLSGTKVSAFALPSKTASPTVEPLAGPLCVFVPANAHDAKHEAELLAFVESWADNSTVLFSERKNVLELAATRQRGISLQYAELATWNEWHQKRVLAEAKLRRRGATPDSIRGRGQLSIPLFHWISQLVKRNDPLVQNCRWFMKCDTDTYLRRGLLEREVLSKLDHTKPYHVGVPLNFNTRPYHHTLRNIRFDYNIGGPGYTFSRALMDAVDVDACVRSMTLDPVLLIHDDVATGFCATYYSGPSALVEIRTAISSSAGGPVTRLLTGNNALTPINGYIADLIRNDSCVSRFTAAHPVQGVAMRMLAHHDRTNGVASETLTGSCDMKIMAGTDVKIGRDWTMDKDLRNMFDQWKWLWVDRRKRFVPEKDRPKLEKALDLHQVLFAKD